MYCPQTLATIPLYTYWTICNTSCAALCKLDYHFPPELRGGLSGGGGGGGGGGRSGRCPPPPILTNPGSLGHGPGGRIGGRGRGLGPILLGVIEVGRRLAVVKRWADGLPNSTLLYNDEPQLSSDRRSVMIIIGVVKMCKEGKNATNLLVR